jgi:hypothetical protein
MQKNRSLAALASLLIFSGILLTLENYQVIHGMARHWPALVFFLGAGFGLLFFKRKRNDAALIWISSFLIFISLFFYYLGFYSWTKLDHLCPVFLGIIGGCFLSVGLFIRKRAFFFLSIVFMAFFITFYLIFTLSYRLWPISMVVFGSSLLILDFVMGRRR